MSEIIKYTDADSIKEHISFVLTRLKKKFTLTEDKKYEVLIFELDVNPEVVYIDVSYLDEDGNFSPDGVEIVFYTHPSQEGHIFYENTFIPTDSEDLTGDLESEISELLEQSKVINKALKKIHKKLQDIEEICSEVGISFEDFITVEYSFQD